MFEYEFASHARLGTGHRVLRDERTTEHRGALRIAAQHRRAADIA